jgi:hypothetical protein
VEIQQLHNLEQTVLAEAEEQVAVLMVKAVLLLLLELVVQV